MIIVDRCSWIKSKAASNECDDMVEVGVEAVEVERTRICGSMTRRDEKLCRLLCTDLPDLEYPAPNNLIY